MNDTRNSGAILEVRVHPGVVAALGKMDGFLHSLLGRDILLAFPWQRQHTAILLWEVQLSPGD